MRALLFAPLLAIAAAAPARAAAPDPPPPLRLALQTDSAFGIAPGDFRNHLFGARLDFEFSPRVSFGAYVGYANLKGKEGRAHDLLAYGQVEYLAGRTDSTIRFPLRFASGYLPWNGPVARFAAGIAIRISPRTYLVAEPFAPMFWITREQMLLSMNLALELVIRL